MKFHAEVTVGAFNGVMAVAVARSDVWVGPPR
jgi:hypothetical protein